MDAAGLGPDLHCRRQNPLGGRTIATPPKDALLALAELGEAVATSAGAGKPLQGSREEVSPIQ